MAGNMQYFHLSPEEMWTRELKFDVFPLKSDNSSLPSMERLCYNYTQESAKNRKHLERCNAIQKYLRLYRDYACSSLGDKSL